tara:strand:- start:462 stop:1298 length:837 start_codon:yes stop_codon:yes gene_type:complete
LDIIRSNYHGVLEYTGNGNYKFYPAPKNSSTFLNIEISSTYVKYSLPDGSFLKADATNGHLTRFNSSNGISELFTPQSSDITNWQVSSQNDLILQSYVEFENTGDDYPGGFCYEPGTEVAFPCPLNGPGVPNFNSSSTSPCSQQQNYLDNHGYNGYPTLSACLRPAEQVSLASAFLLLAGCTVGQVTIAGCSVSLISFAAATGNYNHVAHQCNLTYNTARSNLAQCLDSPEKSGGGGSSGDPGTVQPTVPAQCYEVIQHGVCTGGGCTYWSEIRMIPC